MTDIALVDDHPVFREGLRVLLESAGMRVVGESETGRGAVALLEQSPDLIVVDLGLPDISGIDAIRLVIDREPSARVLVLTMYNDDDAVARALEAGARGYLVKNAPAAEVLAAVRAVVDGAIVLGSVLAPRIPRIVADGAIRTATLPASRFPTMSERERQVLGMLSAGLSNPVIAERLGVAEKTVANYVSTVLTKLGVRDRAAAARLVAETSPDSL